MNCTTCKVENDKKFKYCPECGTKFDVDAIIDLNDILDSYFGTTSLIYDAQCISDKIYDFKLDELGMVDNIHKSLFAHIDRKACYDNFSFGLGTIILPRNRNMQLFDKNFDMREICDEFDHSKLSERRLIGNDPILDICGIKNSSYRSSKNIHIQQFRHILISLIENKIEKPHCGYDLIAKTNHNLVTMWNDLCHNRMKIEKYIKSNIKSNIIFTMKIIDENELTSDYEEKLYNNFNIMVHGGSKEKYITDIKNAVHNLRDELGMYKEAQKNLDEKLKLITYDIYYSKKTKDIMTKEALMEKINFFKDKVDIDINKNCILQKIQHINIFVLNDSIEDLLTLSKIKKCLNIFDETFKPKEGVTKFEIIASIFG